MSRVPLSGHPENKYVVSRASAEHSAGVRQKGVQQFQVQYDAKGTIGPVILQPNKYFYLQKVAFRIGRDIKKYLTLDTKKVDRKVYLDAQYRAIGQAVQYMNPIYPPELSSAKLLEAPSVGPVEVTLERMARELNKIAPDLAQDAGIDPDNMDEKAAGTLLQMEILEEVSNNWESRFPEKEHVWEFAKPRVELRDRTIRGRVVKVRDRQLQYFHLCRYPPCLQTKANQTIIEDSGPRIQEKPKLKPAPTQPAIEQPPDRRPLERHHGSRHPPNYLFGETPLAEAYLSHQMEIDLADGK